jgi:hypothetical protein
MTPLDGGMVIFVPGKLAITSVGDLIRFPSESAQVRFAKPVTGDNVPRAGRDGFSTGSG